MSSHQTVGWLQQQLVAKGAVGWPASGGTGDARLPCGENVHTTATRDIRSRAPPQLGQHAVAPVAVSVDRPPGLLTAVSTDCQDAGVLKPRPQSCS